MKISYIANLRLPTEKAHGIQIMKMCEAFSYQGAEVTLVVPRRFNNVKKDPFSYYGVTGNFRIIKLPVIDLVSFGKIGFLIEALSFAISSFVYVVFNKSDILYTRDEMAVLLLSLFKKNIVWEAHMPRNSTISRFTIKRSNLIVTISNGLKDFFVEKQSIPQEKILVSHDAVDLNDFIINKSKEDARESLGLSNDSFIVMYIGRLDSWKGVETLLRATKEVSDIETVIIGEGNNLARYKKKYPHAQYLGCLPYKDLPINQKAADILVIPNSKKSKISTYYTSPLKVFAHMTSGVPIVVSDLPSMREVLNDSNAYFAEADNHESFKDVILYIKNNYNELRSRATVALENVEDYTWKKRATAIINFYNENN